MRSDKLRKFRQELKKITPKKVRVSANYCKYGRVYLTPGTTNSYPFALIMPVNGNPNYNIRT